MDSLRWMSPEQPELSARGFCKCSQPWEGRSWEAQKGAGIHSITLNRGLPGGDLSVPWEILVLGKSHCFCRFWLLAFANLAGLASKVRTKTFRFCERINSKSSKVALAMRLVPLSRFGRFGSVGMVWDGHRNLQCYRLLCVSQRSCGLAVKFRAAWLPIACQSWYNMSFHELSLDFTRSLYDQEADAEADWENRWCCNFSAPLAACSCSHPCLPIPAYPSCLGLEAWCTAQSLSIAFTQVAMDLTDPGPYTYHLGVPHSAGAVWANCSWRHTARTPRPEPPFRKRNELQIRLHQLDTMLSLANPGRLLGANDGAEHSHRSQLQVLLWRRQQTANLLPETMSNHIDLAARQLHVLRSLKSGSNVQITVNHGKPHSNAVGFRIVISYSLQVIHACCIFPPNHVLLHTWIESSAWISHTYRLLCRLKRRQEIQAFPFCWWIMQPTMYQFHPSPSCTLLYL